MRLTHLSVTFGAALALASACGGRQLADDDEDDYSEGGDGIGGSATTGGAGGKGGGVGRGGAGGKGGGTGGDGATGTGGDGAMGGTGGDGATGGTGGDGAMGGTGNDGAMGGTGGDGAMGGTGGDGAMGGTGGDGAMGGTGGDDGAGGSGGASGQGGAGSGGVSGTGGGGGGPAGNAGKGGTGGAGAGGAAGKGGAGAGGSSGKGGSGGAGGAANVVVSATARGWYKESGDHDALNDNTLTGWSYSGSYAEYRSYLTFELPSFTGNVLSVTLRLEHEAYNSGDASETFVIYDVTTPAATVEAIPDPTSAGIPVFTDLGSGTLFGSFMLTPATVSTIREIPLNEDAATAVDAARGTSFTLGFSMTTHEASPNVNEYARFSLYDENRTHELVITTAPSGG